MMKYSGNLGIQHIIHQIWFQGEGELPNRYLETRSSWQENNPRWQYEFWDENRLSRLILKDYPSQFDAWSALDKIIKKCDAARCFLLHRFGGVYADLDTICHRPLDELIEDFSLEQNDITFSEEAQDVNEHFHWKADLKKLVMKEYDGERFVGNAVLISKKGADFWIDFLHESFKISDKSVLESFSTWHLTKFLDKYKNQYSIRVLPFENILSPKFERGISYVTHNYDATWFNNSSEKPWEG